MSSTAQEDINSKTLKELAIKLREAFENRDRHDKKYPGDAGAIPQHLIWKAATKVAEKVGYGKGRK